MRRDGLPLLPGEGTRAAREMCDHRSNKGERDALCLQETMYESGSRRQGAPVRIVMSGLRSTHRRVAAAW